MKIMYIMYSSDHEEYFLLNHDKTKRNSVSYVYMEALIRDIREALSLGLSFGFQKFYYGGGDTEEICSFRNLEELEDILPEYFI